MTDPIRYARLVRAFPIKRLHETLFHVEADANSLHQELIRILADPPAIPEDWCQALQRITGLLFDLEEHAEAARATIDALYLDADRDFDSSVNAVKLMLKGMHPSVPVTPEEDEAWDGKEAA